MDPRLTLPVPEPEAMEESVAAALRIRDFDLALEQFWPRNAFQLAGQERDGALFAALDARWAELRAKTVHDLVEAASRETDRISKLVWAAPPHKQSMEWTVQRGQLSDARQRNRGDEAFRAELIGADWQSKVDWLARMNEWQSVGARLKEAWADWRMRSTLGGPTPSLPREPELERRIGEDPNDSTPRQIYADWLQEREVALGELAALRMRGRPARWKAELLEELTDVLGPLGALVPARIEITHPLGFFEDAAVVWAEPSPARALALLLAHPGSVTLESLEVDDGWWTDEGRARRSNGSPAASDPHEALVGTLVAAGRRPCLEELKLSVRQPAIALAPLAALYPRLTRLEARSDILGVDSAAWPKLRDLVLEALDVTPVLAGLAGWDAPGLEELFLVGSRWPGAPEVAAAARRFPRLKSFTAAGLVVQPGTLVPLLRALHTPALQGVHLPDAQAEAGAVDELIAAAPDLGHLRELTLGDSRVGPRARERLTAALPLLELRADDFDDLDEDEDDDA